MKYHIFKILLVQVIFLGSINANEILSKTQNKILSLSQDKIDEDASKLKKDWINTINYSFIYSKEKDLGTSKKSTISINQAIFRSGGIYYAIKYAANLQSASSISLEIQKKELIAQTLNTVFNINKLDLQIKKQKLLIANSKIDLKIKKESVFNGILSLTFLNNAIISLNKTKLSLVNLKYSRDNLINTLHSLSDKKYFEISLPKLKMIDKKDFIKKNINLKNSRLNLKMKDDLKGITNAKYLPSVYANYKKTIAHSNTKDKYNYGLTLNIPLTLNALHDVQSTKLTYLKQKEQNNLELLKENLYINTKMLSLNNIKNKTILTKQNIKSYQDLLDQTQELSDAGLKTFDDIIILNNSLKNEQLDIDIYKIDEQIELLDIYKKLVSNDI